MTSFRRAVGCVESAAEAGFGALFGTAFAQDFFFVGDPQPDFVAQQGRGPDRVEVEAAGVASPIQAPFAGRVGVPSHV